MFLKKKTITKTTIFDIPVKDAKEKLGITPFYDDTIECAYCELADESGIKRCRFFPELDDVPDNRGMIKMWLESEVKDGWVL